MHIPGGPLLRGERLRKEIAMSLPHAAPGEPVDLRRTGGDLPHDTSCALVKTRRFEAMRLILPKGQQAPAHHVDGPLTLQCLEGRVILRTLPKAAELAPGQWLFIEPAEPFAIEAVEDSALLMTLVFEP